MPADDVAVVVQALRDTWGTVDFARSVNPGVDDPAFLEEVARWTRFAATPRAAGAQFAYILGHLDVRDALPLVQAPTRVLHVRDNPIVPLAHGRYVADHIAGATLVELPGGSLSMTPNLDAVLEETVELATGERREVAVERVLTTVLVSDIVGSTERAAALGDRRWRRVARRARPRGAGSVVPLPRPRDHDDRGRVPGVVRRARACHPLRRGDPRLDGATRHRAARRAPHRRVRDPWRPRGRAGGPHRQPIGALAAPGEIVVSGHGEGPRGRVRPHLRRARRAGAARACPACGRCSRSRRADR